VLYAGELPEDGTTIDANVQHEAILALCTLSRQKIRLREPAGDVASRLRGITDILLKAGKMSEMNSRDTS